jgi:preprotein translocase subunit SecF
VGSLLFIGSFFLGAETLKDLALALFVGVAVGAYSSIFLGPPLLAVWKEKEPRYAVLKSREKRRTVEVAKAPAPVVTDADGNGSEDEEVEVPVSRPVGTATKPRTQPKKSQPRKNQSRAKRKGRR